MSRTLTAAGVLALSVLCLPATTTTTTTTAAAAAAPAAPAMLPIDDLTWGACEAGTDPAYDCATFTVPLDYSDPPAGTVDLALIRFPASPQAREGAILLNPGGPGGSGWEFAESAGEIIDLEMGLGGRFDIIGFDPRGVDRSGGIRCIDDRTIEELLYADDTPDGAAEVMASIAQQAQFSIACRQVYGDALRHYSTENTARDMDLIRAALGDEQLSFLGISYGTYLGGVYAALFPERVRAMVLDSAFEPTGDSEYDEWVTQLVGFEQAFDNWAAWCEEGSECDFAAIDVGARWDALITALEATPAKSDSGRAVNHVAMETATVSAMYSENSWPALASALADAETGDGTALLAMADDYNGRAADGTFASIRQSGQVIRCASGIGSGTPADPAALLAQIQAAAPRFSRGYDLSDFRDSCRDLIPADVIPVVPAYDGAAPILVVGGLNDPATPFRWATELTELLGSSAALVTYTGEGHGQLLGSSCVTELEAATLREGVLPAQGTTCDPDEPVARPAIWDQLPVPAGVGPLVDEPALDLALGLPPTQVYADVWHLSGDVANVAAAYETALEALGFDVVGSPESVVPGTTTLVALGADGTQLVILLIPPGALSTADLEAAAPYALPGQGFVVIASPPAGG